MGDRPSATLSGSFPPRERLPPADPDDGDRGRVDRREIGGIDRDAPGLRTAGRTPVCLYPRGISR